MPNLSCFRECSCVTSSQEVRGRTGAARASMESSCECLIGDLLLAEGGAVGDRKVPGRLQHRRGRTLARLPAAYSVTLALVSWCLWCLFKPEIGPKWLK